MDRWSAWPESPPRALADWALNAGGAPLNTQRPATRFTYRWQGTGMGPVALAAR
jgi:hypothetical protein